MKSKVNHVIRRIRLSEVKAKTIAVAVAVAAAVLLPQLAHFAGAAFGAGSGVGEMFLPMQLPVLFIGALMGPWAGLATGCLSPLVSHVLTGMPISAMLPYLMIELSVYGLTAGRMKNKLCKPIVRILVAQVAGRAARSFAVICAVTLLGSRLPLHASWSYITAGVWGIVIQLLVLPVLLSLVERKNAQSSR